MSCWRKSCVRGHRSCAIAGWRLYRNLCDSTLWNRILACENLRALFVELSEDEQTAKDALMEVEKKYPSAVKEDTADSIIAIALQKKKDREGR